MIGIVLLAVGIVLGFLIAFLVVFLFHMHRTTITNAINSHVIPSEKVALIDFDDAQYEHEQKITRADKEGRDLKLEDLL